MPRTPDRFPGTREDEELYLEDQGPGGLAGGDPTIAGSLRYVTNQFRFIDSLGVFDPRSVVSSASDPTASEDGASGYPQGILWVNTTTNIVFISTDDTTSTAVWSPLNLRNLAVEFVLTEDVYNTEVFFTTWRSPSGDSVANKRSGDFGTGVTNPNACSPYQVPFDATIVGATLSVRGVGVQNGSVTYPVSYQTDLFSITGSETKIADIDFSISNSYTVGVYTVAVTSFTGATALNVNVTAGQLLGLKFINGTGASLAGQTRNAFITLLMQERF